MTNRTWAVSAVSAVLLACGAQHPVEEAATSPDLSSETALAAQEASSRGGNGPKLEVMTRNLYLGANIVGITQLDPTDPRYAELLVEFATEFWGDVQASDFPARANVLANEIFWARPEVVGLQEVATYRTTDLAHGQVPGVCLQEASPSAPTASHVELDFLAVLQKALRRRGLSYDVAARVTTTDVELCMQDAASPYSVTGIRYTDHDVILVRKDVKWRAPTLPSGLPVPLSALSGDRNGARFSETLQGYPATACFDVAGASVCSWRGWTAVEVHQGHRWVRVFETHLEDQLAIPDVPADLFQLLQASELVGIVAGAWQADPLPTVLLGDFNAYVNPEKTPEEMAVYGLLVGGPFPLRDAWTALRGTDPGYTWGSEDIGLEHLLLTTRLDLVLSTAELKPLCTYLVGTRDVTRTEPPLHPSDHAGIVTLFALP